jgi:hypothetical protein
MGGDRGHQLAADYGCVLVTWFRAVFLGSPGGGGGGGWYGGRQA